jgi:hypothetical protein
LKKRGDPISAPEAECHKNQPEHGIDFTFNPPDAPLYFIVHSMALSTTLPKQIADFV